MIYEIRNMPQKRPTRLKKIIIESGMTQKEIAGRAGIEEWQISQLATGESNDCLLSTAKKICNVLDVNLHSAFGD